MIYKAYLKQEGGCDYTIACGYLVIDLESTNMEDAIKETKSIIDEEYYDDRQLYSVEIYEINKVEILDTDEFYSSREERLKREKDEEDRIKRFNEFKKLKKEFGDEDIQ